MFGDYDLREAALLSTLVTAPLCFFYGSKISKEHPTLSLAAKVAGGISVFIGIHAFVYLV